MNNDFELTTIVSDMTHDDPHNNHTINPMNIDAIEESRDSLQLLSNKWMRSVAETRKSTDVNVRMLRREYIGRVKALRDVAVVLGIALDTDYSSFA